MSFTGLGSGRRVEGRAERGRLQRIKGARHARLACEALEDRIALAISTWSGLASTLWSGAGNWDVPAVAGNSLVFPAAATQKSSVNDLAAGSSFPALTISGAGYQISGNKAAINAIDDSQTSGTNTLSLPLDVSAATTVTVDSAPETLVLTNALTGSAAFGKFGLGTLSLTGTSTYSGTFTASSGFVRIDGSLGGAAVKVSGARLGGTGAVGSINATAGTVQPGDGSPGILHDNGGLTLAAGVVNSFALNGTVAGASYSQVTVGGPIDLGGSTLSATLGFVPTANETFTIIKNNGGAAITNTFLNLAEGGVTTIGGEPFRISYVGGSGHDVVLTHLLTPTAAVTFSPANPALAQSVTLTATVAATSGTGTPTGTVQFFNGATSLGTKPLSGGTATLVLTTLPAGNNAITVNYAGDPSFGPITSQAAVVPVGLRATTATLSSAPTAATIFGQPVTFGVTVAPGSGAGTPTGTVKFFSGTQPIGTATLNSSGSASIILATLAVGTDAVTAQYQGDTTFGASVSAVNNRTVTQAHTSVTLFTTPTSTSPGLPVTLTAQVAIAGLGSGTPTGSIQFFNGTTLLGSTALSSGIASLAVTTLPIGANAITAKYVGDKSFAASTSAASTVTVVGTSSTTTLTASSGTTLAGQPVTFTAKVAAGGAGVGTPTGSVQFLDGTTVIGTSTVNTGVATFATSSLSAGSHTITAKYLGDATFATSTSTALTQNVGLQQTTVGLVVTPAGKATLGAPVTLSSTVKVIAPGTTQPTGSVSFLNGTVLLGTVPLINGTAVFTTSALPVGLASITAKYLGDPFHAANSSAVVGLTVGSASQLYLSQLYLNILGRQPTSAELQKGTAALAKGVKRLTIVNGILHTFEARTVAVQRAFQGYLSRAATVAEVSRYIAASRSTGNDVRVPVLASNEFLQSSGNGSAEGFLTALASVAAGPTYPAFENQTYSAELLNGTSRTKVVEQVLHSSVAASAEVKALYRIYLGRDPKAAEFALGVAAIARGVSPRDIEAGLLASQEFYTRATTGA